MEQSKALRLSLTLWTYCKNLNGSAWGYFCRICEILPLRTCRRLHRRLIALKNVGFVCSFTKGLRWRRQYRELLGKVRISVRTKWCEGWGPNEKDLFITLKMIKLCLISAYFACSSMSSYLLSMSESKRLVCESWRLFHANDKRKFIKH